MSDWKHDDEVTTTYGSIQLGLEQAHSAGIKTERERIIKLLEQHLDYDKYEGIGIGDRIAKVTDIIALINGETNE